MIDVLFVIVGAAIALFSYSYGKNGVSPIPKFTVPFTRKQPSNGEATKPPVQSRGM